MEGPIETQRRPVAFRFELRSATRGEHRSLDEHPAFVALAAGRLGIDGYRNLMGLFHGLYVGLDDALDDGCRRLLPRGCGYAYMRRQSMLAGDLEHLGGGMSRQARAPAPHASLAGLCGALYVVEGSVLGGAMLQRAASALLADREGGDAYWRWCRDFGGPRWAATCDLIEANAATGRSRDEMVLAARETFDLFAEWLGGWSAEATREPATIRPAPC